MTEGQDVTDREAVKNIGPSGGPGNQYDEYGCFHGRNTNLSKL